MSVCVVAGVFTRRANNRGAVATLAVGVLLGLIAFLVLNRPTLVSALPPYFRNSLNVGFTITVLCAIVMFAVSRWAASEADAAAGSIVSRAVAGQAMGPLARRVFRLVLIALAVVWLCIVFAFSPWGLAPRREHAATEIRQG